MHYSYPFDLKYHCKEFVHSTFARTQKKTTKQKFDIIIQNDNAAFYCRGRQVVLWIDNWCRPRYTTDPQRENASLNVSVMAVLHITRAASFRGHPTLADMFNCMPSVADSLVSQSTKLISGVNIILSEEVTTSDIRVPLDVQRTGMRSLQWRPYMLTDLSVSSQDELIHG